jgi:hypothetical protein
MRIEGSTIWGSPIFMCISEGNPSLRNQLLNIMQNTRQMSQWIAGHKWRQFLEWGTVNWWGRTYYSSFFLVMEKLKLRFTQKLRRETTDVQSLFQDSTFYFLLRIYCLVHRVKGNVQNVILRGMLWDFFFIIIPVTRSLSDSSGVMSCWGIMTGGKRCLHFSLNNMFTGDDVFGYVLLDKQRHSLNTHVNQNTNIVIQTDLFLYSCFIISFISPVARW